MMLKRFLIKFFYIFILAFSATVFAETVPLLGEQDHFYLDKTQLVAQQIDLLKKRVVQADQELSYLRHQQGKGFISLTDNQTSSFLLYKMGLHVESVQSNIDSINIELTDSQQAVAWLEKNTQEVENQLNALNIFGLKLIHGDVSQIKGLRLELKYQQDLLQLEKMRSGYLNDLQESENTILRLYRQQHAEISAFLKSRKMLRIKEQQVKSEMEFQQQQQYWLQQLESLYAEVKSDKSRSKGEYARLEGDLFYANENINIVYLKTLIARYQDQVRQMQLSITRTNSISLLNTLSDQAQALGKQIVRVDDLVSNRVDIIKKRNVIEVHELQNTLQGKSNAAFPMQTLENAYQNLHEEVVVLDKRLTDFSKVLGQSIQHELSARQGLPGFGSGAWLDLGKEMLLAPTLSFQLIKGLPLSFATVLRKMTVFQWALLLLFEATWVTAFFSIKKKVTKKREQFSASREQMLIHLKHVLLTFLLRHLVLLAIIGNIWSLFYFLSIPVQQFYWLFDLTLVWLFFKGLLILARTALLETVHDGKGMDVRLYHRLRTIFIYGTVITSLTVFLHQLPLIYEIKDLFDRLFLFMLLIASVLILRSWRVVPQLVLQYIEHQQMYLRHMIYFLGALIPGLFFVNSLIGLFGFVNLVWMISWYQGIFILVLMSYFFLRGLLSDGMEAVSKVMIRRVTNGWLWTEAFLKPLHNLLRLGLFFGAWMMLFLFYGWNQQSPVVERLNKLFFYPIVSVLNTTITPVSLFELAFAISLFYWAARWTRELVFRMLLSKTRDLGIRNSMAILSQYAVVMLGILMCLRLVGIDLHALFLVASGLLIAISFGMKDLVNNFACGLLLLFERPIRVGDIVSVDNQEGKVTHIGGRAVTVRTWDYMDVIIPNAELFNKSFINWTVRDDIVRTVIVIKIDREDNPYDVQKIIHEVLQGHKDVLREPIAEVFLRDIIDNANEFEVRYYINVRQVKSRVSVRSEVLFALWNVFAQHGIKSPNLQHEIFVKGEDTTPHPPLGHLLPQGEKGLD